ncbi:hypothetical protein ACFX13_000142 [Malus domestica]
MQVRTTDATSIEEQLVQMNEAIARLTMIVEEKDFQIATLVNHLEVQHDEKVDVNVDPPKEETDEKDEHLMDKVEEKLEVDQAVTLMGSLLIQQLQEMITSIIKAQYEGRSHDSVLYLKPY